MCCGSTCDKYFAALLVTLYEVALAMVIACGFGILVGAIVGGIAVLRNLLLPVFSSLYAVPIVILYPIFTAWFGIGSESKIMFAGIYGFFPVMLSTAAGIRTIDPQYLLAARSMGATIYQQITRVIIPASLPTVFSGLRLGGALAIIGVVVSEMLTASAGIGYLVTLNRTILDSPRVFAGDPRHPGALDRLSTSWRARSSGGWWCGRRPAARSRRRRDPWHRARRRPQPHSHRMNSVGPARSNATRSGTRRENDPWPTRSCPPPSSAATRSPIGSSTARCCRSPCRACA